MPIYQYVILSSAVAGREAECDSWYDDVHLADVARVAGVVSARRFPIVSRKCDSLDIPAWRSLAIYEIGSETPEQVIAEIAALSGSEAMPISEALALNGLVEILAAPLSGQA